MDATLPFKSRLIKSESGESFPKKLIHPICKTLRSREEKCCMVSYLDRSNVYTKFRQIPECRLQIIKELFELAWNDPKSFFSPHFSPYVWKNILIGSDKYNYILLKEFLHIFFDYVKYMYIYFCETLFNFTACFFMF